jgi:hypothetical protein
VAKGIRTPAIRRRSTRLGRVLKAYITLEPITRPFFTVNPSDPARSFAVEAHPVFRLVPA